MSRRIITLLTDFGTKDGYAGSMKGIIKSMLPDADIIDIAHDITSFDIDEAAYAVFNYYSSFPKGTVHLTVIDPGVGSEREGIIVKTEKYYFVGPDNGIFKLIFSFEKHKVFIINNDYFGRHSNTFHGRDIFAPAAVKIAAGDKIETMAAENTHKRKNAELYRFDEEEMTVETPAITIDRFGNIITPYCKGDLLKTGRTISRVRVKNTVFNSVSSYYGQHGAADLLVLWNSLGFLEIAANRASAAEILNFNKNNDKIYIKLK